MLGQQTTAAASGTYLLGDLPVNRIGFGAKRLAGGGDVDIRSAVHRDRLIRLLRRAVDLGVNHIDTAAFYPTFATAGQPMHDFTSRDWANELIREALAPYPADLVIATKVGPTKNGLARPERLRGQVEDNLRQLGLDTLPVVNLRQGGLTSVSEHMGALAELQQAGLIRHLGVSNVRHEHLEQAQAVAPVVCVQNRYGLDFGRVNDDLLETCGELGIAFVPFFALAGSSREAGGVVHNDAVLEIARARGVTPAQVRIAWTLTAGGTSSSSPAPAASGTWPRTSPPEPWS